MATRKIIERRMMWHCMRCGKHGSKHVETTQTAEEHADETGHEILAVGILTYNIGPGLVAEDDPFAAKTSPRAVVREGEDEDA